MHCPAYMLFTLMAISLWTHRLPETLRADHLQWRTLNGKEHALSNSEHARGGAHLPYLHISVQGIFRRLGPSGHHSMTECALLAVMRVYED